MARPFRKSTQRRVSTLSFSLFDQTLSPDPGFAQEGHHGAPVGKGRLEQVEPNENREQIPVGIDVIAERYGQYDEKSCNHSQISVYGHFSFSSMFFIGIHADFYVSSRLRMM
jgi:hypothetical protein